MFYLDEDNLIVPDDEIDSTSDAPIEFEIPDFLGKIEKPSDTVPEEEQEEKVE
jgi:hypothetical protein